MRHALASLLFSTTFLLAATASAQPAPPPPSPSGAGPADPLASSPPATAPAPGGQPAPAPPGPGQATPPPAAGPMGAPPGPMGAPPGPMGAPPGPMGPPPGQGLPPPGPMLGSMDQPQPPGAGWPGPAQPPHGNPSPPWMPPAAQPPADAIPGMMHGAPLSRRGHIAVDAAGFKQESSDATLVALALDVHMPVAARTFVDARLPMFGIHPGNIMLGAGRVARIGQGGFLAYDAQIGLPLVANREATDFSLPHGTWNVHEYAAYFVPLKIGLGYERLTRYLEIRIDLQPVLLLPTVGQDVNLTFQHAAELQVGHMLGGGVRLQGVAVTSGVFDDAYQFSVEPFLVVRRDLGFARLGLMMPIDESVAGPAFEQAWGLRLMTGLHID